MRNASAFRALFLATGLMVAAPALSMAADLSDNVNNQPVTGSPFAHSMSVTQSSEHGLPGNVGQSASAEGNPLTTPVGTTVRHNSYGSVPGPVGNSANAQGGFGTGQRLG